MSRYSTPFCSDEELLKELNKFGYDEVSPEVFERMKNGLSELVSKNENDHVSVAENYNFSLSECGDNNESSKYLSATSDDGEWRTTQDSYRKTDSCVSRKTKRKSQKISLCRSNDHEDDVFRLESNKFQNTNNGLEIKSSYASLDYSNTNDDDIMSDCRKLQDKRAKASKLKSNDIYGTRNSKVDHNKNDDIRYTRISKKLSSEEDDFESNYIVKNDILVSGVSDSSAAKIKNKITKERNNKSSKSWKKIQDLSDTENVLHDNTLKSVNDAFKAFNLEEDYPELNSSTLNNYKCPDINLNTSDTISEKKTLKRKILRRRNGKSVITEELIEIPSIFDTSYPESENLNSSKSFSSDDLSYKSNSSTGSVTVLSPESIKSSPSTFSLSSRSTSLRISNTRKKKSDPVAMYNYYKKFWDNFKPPGENNRDRLRWAVRDKMLEYHI